MGNLGQIRLEEPRTTFLSGDSGKWHDHPTSRTDHETEDLRVRIMFGGGSRPLIRLLSPPRSDFAVDRSLLIIARAAGDPLRQLCCDDKARLGRAGWLQTL